jgi:hypothetical protein
VKSLNLGKKELKNLSVLVALKFEVLGFVSLLFTDN